MTADVGSRRASPPAREVEPNERLAPQAREVELEERIARLERLPSRDFDARAWFWMLLFGIAVPVVLLVVGWRT